MEVAALLLPYNSISSNFQGRRRYLSHLPGNPMAVPQTRASPVRKGHFLPTAYRKPPAMATSGRHHPYSIGIGPGTFAFPYPSSLVSAPAPIAPVKGGSKRSAQNMPHFLKIYILFNHFVYLFFVAPPVCGDAIAAQGLDQVIHPTGGDPST